MPWIRSLVALVCLLIWLSAPGAVRAAASDWERTEHSAVRLVAAVTAVGDESSIPLGLQFELTPGWKIYWRSPGDAGFPPQVDWSGSENLASTEVSWPAPHRFSVQGLETLGYEDAALLPIVAIPATPGHAVGLRAMVDYLACKEICVPETATLSLDLPAGPAATSPFAHLVAQWREKVPGDGSAHGLSIDGLEADGARIRVTAGARSPFQAPDVFVEGAPELAFAKPTTSLTEDGQRAVFVLAVEGLRPTAQPLVGRTLTLTLVDGGRAAERALEVAPAATAPADVSSDLSLAMILALAVLGGLILNLMPCVLPVLSLKLLGVVGHGGGDTGTVRLSFIASAAGILVSFLLLAAALAGLKDGGAVIGWGIQFQHPWFLVAMILVVTLFACNLWGILEVRLPEWIGDLGEHASHVHGLGGHFLQGMLATLLATPCSAPFLGTAVGFALARGSGEILAVFAALGLGLALPYLVVAALPGLATRLPRPGAWMVRLRQVLGVALAGTGVWLLTVLAGQAGPEVAGAVGGLAATAALVLSIRHRDPDRLGRLAMMAVVVLAGLAFVAAETIDGTVIDGRDRLKGVWTPFDEAAIPGLVAAGRVVFVDVTADWCLTCQVNKSLVLSRGAALERLSAPGVVAMQADWTRPDDAISRYLAKFGRYGIPFDAVYGPGAPEGVALPELLTEEAVLNAFGRATGQ